MNLFRMKKKLVLNAASQEKIKYNKVTFKKIRNNNKMKKIFRMVKYQNKLKINKELKKKLKKETKKA